MARLFGMLLIGALIAALHAAQAARPQAGPPLRTPSADASTTIFLPMVRVGPDLAGTYDCLEYEFGLVWTSEVVALRPDGTSVYTYAPPYSAVATGTWVYTPTTAEVGFTNFRWLTATVQLPNRLWASRYLPSAGFEVALGCTKQY